MLCWAIWHSMCTVCLQGTLNNCTVSKTYRIHVVEAPVRAAYNCMVMSQFDHRLWKGLGGGSGFGGGVQKGF